MQTSLPDYSVLKTKTEFWLSRKEQSMDWDSLGWKVLFGVLTGLWVIFLLETGLL